MIKKLLVYLSAADWEAVGSRPGIDERLSSMKDSWFLLSSSFFPAFTQQQISHRFLALESYLSVFLKWAIIVVKVRRKRRALKMSWLLSWKHWYTSCSMTGVFMRSKRRCSRSCCNGKWVGTNTKSIRQYWLVAQSHGEVIFEEVYQRYREVSW